MILWQILDHLSSCWWWLVLDKKWSCALVVVEHDHCVDCTTFILSVLGIQCLRWMITVHSFLFLIRSSGYFLFVIFYLHFPFTVSLATCSDVECDSLLSFCASPWPTYWSSKCMPQWGHIHWRIHWRLVVC
jgi:hypothetical protein